jgi:hypothetical protein
VVGVGYIEYIDILWRLDGAAMTRLVMGNTEGEKAPIQLSGALGEVIPALFPLPSFLPGINYLWR